MIVLLVLVLLALVVAVVAVPLGYVVRTRNRLVGLGARCDEAWSDVDAELRRRHDLVPDLVATVRGYAAHEAGVLDAVTTARAAAVAAAGVTAGGPAEDALTEAVRPVVGLAERYPPLGADDHFRTLELQLAATEDEIAAARRIYNSNVAAHNAALTVAPASTVASVFGLRPRPLFGR